MLAALATGAPATGSPSIAGHRCKNTLAKPPTLTSKVPPSLDVFAVCVDSSAGISVQLQTV